MPWELTALRAFRLGGGSGSFSCEIHGKAKLAPYRRFRSDYGINIPIRKEKPTEGKFGENNSNSETR